jgi:hypothetical protein
VLTRYWAPDSVLRVVGSVGLTHRACRVFVHPALDLAQCVETRVFLECGYILVSQMCGVEPELT